MTASDDARIARDSLTGSHAGRTTQGLDALDRLVARVEQAEANERHMRNLHDWRVRDLEDAQRRVQQAERERDEEVRQARSACNICGKPWPRHYKACAYVATARDKIAAEARNAALTEALERIERGDAGLTGAAVDIARAALAAADRPEGTTPTDHKEDA